MAAEEVEYRKITGVRFDNKWRREKRERGILNIERAHIKAKTTEKKKLVYEDFRVFQERGDDQV